MLEIRQIVAVNKVETLFIYYTMELCNFRGTLYGKVNTQLFVWESEWETFRPIDSIGWNGREITHADSYRKNIFDPWYGFGSEDMKKVCKRLTEITELGVPESETIPWMKGEWWRDRECCFISECTPRTAVSWQRYIKYMHSKPKTLRNHKHNRATKRLVPK